MYKNSMISGLLGFFVPALKLFAPRERIARHLRTKKYPFSSTRQDASIGMRMYMRLMPNGHIIMQRVSGKFLRLQTFGHDDYLMPDKLYTEAVTSRRNKNKQGGV